MDSTWTGLQVIGRTTTYIKTAAIVAIACCLMSVAASLACASVRDKHSDSASGTLSNVACTNKTRQGSPATVYYECSADTSYTVQGVPYTHPFTFGGLPRPYENAQTVPVYYDAKDPTDAVVTRPPTIAKLASAVAVSCSVVFVAILWAFFIRRSDTAAGLVGVNDVSSLARRGYRGLMA